MNENVPTSIQEVWDWKKAGEVETRGMTREQLIKHFRATGDELEKYLGVNLPRASETHDSVHSATTSNKLH
ncbi:MAG: hypothetical protein AABZ08_05810 [Planctomycetota bacterium]